MTSDSASTTGPGRLPAQRTAVITGAGGPAGIGRVTARILAENGWHVALVDINADGPLDRPFVGAQLAADSEFRAVFGPRVESTTLALAWVASGQRVGYVTDGHHEGSVHFTAGIALCQAAGCVVSDFDGGPVHAGPGIVAARDAATHATLLRLVARHRRR